MRQYLSPPRFTLLAGKLTPCLYGVGLVLLALGLWQGLMIAPTDSQQGEVYRVLFVHVPAAWMSMFLYLVACTYAVFHWVYRGEVAAVMMRAFLPTGAWMTVLALLTGSLWGKPTQGTYWVWDARMSTELLLLFIYLGLMALTQLSVNPSKTDRLLAVALLIGAVNIPLIYLSVIFMNTLHQGYSISLSGNRMHSAISVGLYLSAAGFWLLCAGTVLGRARALLILRKWSVVK